MVPQMRLFEWMTSLMMLGISVTIVLSPATVSRGGFALVENVGLTPSVLGLLFTIGGALRFVALYANGHWPVVGPRLRAFCALGGALVWAQMLVALLKWSCGDGYISLGVPVYLFLTIGELLSCWRAATDSRWKKASQDAARG